MRRASTTAGSWPPGWDWCPDRTPAAASRSCWASASAATSYLRTLADPRRALGDPGGAAQGGRQERLAAPACWSGATRTWRPSRWPTRTRGSSGRCWPTTESSEPTTRPRPRPRSRSADRQRRIRHRRSHHRLLRRSRSDGKTGKTVVGKAQIAREHLECDKAIEEPTSKSHQGQRPRRNESPNVRVQSLPSSHHELKAWQTGGVHAVIGKRPLLAEGV